MGDEVSLRHGRRVAVKHGCCVDGSCSEKTCMQLPQGESCGTCKHFDRCKAFGFTPDANRTDCDFFPRSFLRKETP